MENMLKKEDKTNNKKQISFAPTTEKLKEIDIV